MENEKLLTVKQFADSVGMTQQGIYRQLNNKLKLYFKIVDGKKMIKADALKLFENEFNNSLTTDSEEFNNRIEQLNNDVELLNNTLTTVKQQLSETIIKSEFKDETITKQQEEIETLKSENQNLTDKLIETEKQLADARARAEEREKIIVSLKADKEKQNDIIEKMQEDNADVVTSLKQLTADNTKLQYQIQEYQKPKTSIFKRLFSRNK